MYVVSTLAYTSFYLLAADDTNGGMPTSFFLNYGLGGVLLLVGIWALRWLANNAIKPFVDSVVVNQRAQTATMIEMGSTIGRILVILDQMNSRLTDHMGKDEQIDGAILTEIRSLQSSREGDEPVKKT